MIGLTRITGGEDEAGFDFLVESVRSLMPAMDKLGIASASEIDIDTLKESLLAEAASGDHCIYYPRLVGAWASQWRHAPTASLKHVPLKRLRRHSLLVTLIAQF